MLSARKMQLSCGNVLSIVTEAKSLITPETDAVQYMPPCYRNLLVPTTSLATDAGSTR